MWESGEIDPKVSLLQPFTTYTHGIAGGNAFWVCELAVVCRHRRLTLAYVSASLLLKPLTQRLCPHNRLRYYLRGTQVLLGSLLSTDNGLTTR